MRLRWDALTVAMATPSGNLLDDTTGDGLLNAADLQQGVLSITDARSQFIRRRRAGNTLG